MSGRAAIVMKYLFVFLFLLLFLSLLFDRLTSKYLNPYKLYLIFGKKGCGKSTLLQKLAVYYRKRGYHVYCNIGDTTIKECTPIPIDDLPRLAAAAKDKLLSEAIAKEYKEKKITSPPFVKSNSVILCDEINLLWDNRDFKNFSKDMQRYFRLQRHYKHIFIGFSQTYDCDKKIRDLADVLLICKRTLRVFVTTKAYQKKVVIVSPKQDNSRDTATMTDDFVALGRLWDWSHPFRAWLPKWVKVHDSFK